MLFLFDLSSQEEFHQSIPLNPPKTKRISFKDETDKFPRKDYIRNHRNPDSPMRNTASEYTPKAHTVADYIMWVNILTMYVEKCFSVHVNHIVDTVHILDRLDNSIETKGRIGLFSPCHATSLCRKYPEISCVEEQERYRAVFNDQYQEYKDLHRDINTTLNKFRELDAMMAQLLRDGKSREVRWV